MLAPPRILLVDDDALFREMLWIMLQRARPCWHLSIAQHGQDAYAAYHRHGADLILTDDMMPVMSGLELVRTLRAEQHTVPIVMLTSRSTTRVTMMPDLYTVIESKPIGMRHLLTIMDTFLTR